jgi:hypothetical protein
MWLCVRATVQLASAESSVSSGPEDLTSRWQSNLYAQAHWCHIKPIRFSAPFHNGEQAFDALIGLKLFEVWGLRFEVLTAVNMKAILLSCGTWRPIALYRLKKVGGKYSFSILGENASSVKKVKAESSDTLSDYQNIRRHIQGNGL